MRFVFAAAVCMAINACSAMRSPEVKTARDIAHALCALHFQQARGISFEDAARLFCTTESVLKPFLDEVLRAGPKAGAAAERALSDAAAPDAGAD